jgi:hypothetical protein
MVVTMPFQQRGTHEAFDGKDASLWETITIYLITYFLGGSL